MADAGAFRFLLPFCREIERVTQKNIRVTLVTRVALYNGIKGFSKSNFLHGMKRRVLNALPSIIAKLQTGNCRASLERWSNGAMEKEQIPTLHQSINPARKSRSGLPAHRDKLRAGRVALAQRPVIG